MGGQTEMETGVTGTGSGIAQTGIPVREIDVMILTGELLALYQSMRCNSLSTG